MYLYGEDAESGPSRLDKRPQVHDSDGLLVKTGSGEWLWRPLHNPSQNLLSLFSVGGSPGGFGLLQRDRQAGHYVDPRVRQEKCPSIWVEPIGPWPAGRVELLEFPSGIEETDNIVAQYVMDQSPQAGSELTLQYRLRFYSQDTPLHGGARVVRTTKKVLAGGSVAYDIDFAGQALASQTQPAGLNPLVTATGGEVTDVRLSKVEGGVYRLSFHASPQGKPQAVELRASLVAGEKNVGETWSDQWKP